DREHGHGVPEAAFERPPGQPGQDDRAGHVLPVHDRIIHWMAAGHITRPGWRRGSAPAAQGGEHDFAAGGCPPCRSRPVRQTAHKAPDREVAVRAVAVLLRAQVRQHWKSWLALAALVTLVGGLVMAAASTARRTAAAFPGFLARHGYDAVVYSAR